jgi:SAM-dependent methyltransferase
MSGAARPGAPVSPNAAPERLPRAGCTPDRLPALVCPDDLARLAPDDAGYHCPACSATYPLRRGVLHLMRDSDAFYEGHYHNHVAFLPRGEAPWQAWPLWLINSGYLWEVRRQVPAGSRVVELGCAGGVAYFGQRYRMIGCDVSRASLERTAATYATCLWADAQARIPLADGSVDAVVSSFFWEHVAPAHKPRVLSECHRVLRPGGKLVFLYDVATENPLIRRYRRSQPERYRELFIDGDGHLGYQTPAENRALFTAAGLDLVERRGLEKTPLQPASVYTKLALMAGPGSRAFRAAEALGKAPLFYPYTALLRTLDVAVAPFLPADWARIELTICEKP